MAKQIGRPKAKLVLTEAEKQALQRLVRRSKTARAVAFRARIVLKCGRGMSNADVAEELETTQQTVGKWRKRFVQHRLDGLLDEPRVGAPRKSL